MKTRLAGPSLVASFVLALALACTAPAELSPEPSASGPSPQRICLTCDPGTGGTSGSAPATGPDLVPKPSSGTYCARDAYGRLVVEIANAGNVDVTVTTTTRITWYYGTSIDRMPYTDVSTPPVAAGSTQKLTVAMPVSCFDPDCSFTITADMTGLVNETNESNDSASDTCQGG